MGDEGGRVEELAEEVAALRAQVAQLAQRAPGSAAPPAVMSPVRRPMSRRGLLLAGAATAAGVAVVSGAAPAHAADGAAILQGQVNAGTNGTGIYSTGGDHGYALVTAGEAGGVKGVVYGSSSGLSLSEHAGVVGDVQAGSGVAGLSKIGSGLRGESTSSNGCFGQSASGSGVRGYCAPGFGVSGESSSGTGVVGFSGGGCGVHGSTETDAPSGNVNAGVLGDGSARIGVGGRSHSGAGVWGTSDPGDAVSGAVSNGLSSGNAVHGTMAGAGVAGRFEITNGANATAALYGVTPGPGQGVKGNATGSGSGVVGTSTSGIGLQGSGGRAALNLVPTKSAGRPTSGAHSRGDLVVDSAGALFLCTTSGTPGTWVRVTVTAA